MNIFFCGLGALGSNAIRTCRILSDVNLAGVDLDTVEKKNVLSQWFIRQMVGRKKAEAIKNQMMNFYGIKVDAFPVRLEAGNVDQLLRGRDLVVETFDNVTSRRLVIDYVREHDIPCVHGALAPDGTLGVVRWSPGFEPDSEDTPGQETCEGGEFLPLIERTSAALAMSIQRFVLDEERNIWTITPLGG